MIPFSLDFLCLAVVHSLAMMCSLGNPILNHAKKSVETFYSDRFIYRLRIEGCGMLADPYRNLFLTAGSKLFRYEFC